MGVVKNSPRVSWEGLVNTKVLSEQSGSAERRLTW